MKKMLPTLAGLTLIASSCAMAAATGQAQTVEGTVTVTGECQLEMYLTNKDVTLTPADVVADHWFETVNLKPSCDSSMWLAYGTPSASGERGMMTDDDTTAEAKNAAYYFNQAGHWDEGNEHYVLDAKGTGGTATAVPLMLTDNDEGLPATGHSYHYSMTGGLWID